MSETFQVRDARDPGYFRIDNELIDLCGGALGPFGIAVYCALARHITTGPETCFVSYQRIADETGMSRRQAIREIEQLESLRLIFKREQFRDEPEGEKRHYVNVYTLLHKSEWQVPGIPSLGGDSQSLGGDSQSLGGDSQSLGGDSQSPDQSSCIKTHLSIDDEEFLLSDLVDIGLSEEVAQGYLAQHGARMAHYLAMALEQGRTNPAGYLVTCVSGGEPRIPYTAKRIECIRDRHRAQKALAQPQPLAAIEGDPDPIDEGMCKRRVIWEDALRELAEQMTRGTFDTWLVGSQLVILDVDRAQVQVRDDNAVIWCREKLNTPIRRTLAGILGAPESFEVGYVAAV